MSLVFEWFKRIEEEGELIAGGLRFGRTCPLKNDNNVGNDLIKSSLEFSSNNLVLWISKILREIFNIHEVHVKMLPMNSVA